jgi:hypothetical protein
MATIVYVLCALTSLACALLLWRSYARTHVRLLLWTFFCFVGFAMSNVMLVVDLRIIHHIDLSLARHAPALAGVLVLLGGMIWESRSA